MAEHNFAISDNGELFVWGHNSFGQLGLGHSLHHQYVPKHLPLYTPIRTVACGFHFTAAITNTGEALVWGNNTYGQLGLGHNNHQDTPQPLPFFEKRPIKYIVCGDQHTAAVTEAGEIYTWGSNEGGQLGLGSSDNKNTPQIVPFFRLRTVKAVACGSMHTMALTDTGELFAWGHNGNGQLGIDVVTPGTKKALKAPQINVLRPQAVPFFQHHNSPIRQLCCGYNHTAVLTQNGEVFVWGRNESGQLGLGNNNNHGSPQLVEFFQHRPVRLLACGWQHSAALTLQGELYVWGLNGNGELGLGHTSNENSPQLVEFFHTRPLQWVACGRSHTLALTKQGAVYGWGRNNTGQLGLANNIDQHSPTLIKFFEMHTIVSLNANGGSHLMSQPLPTSAGTQSGAGIASSSSSSSSGSSADQQQQPDVNQVEITSPYDCNIGLVNSKANLGGYEESLVSDLSQFLRNQMPNQLGEDTIVHFNIVKGGAGGSSVGQKITLPRALILCRIPLLYDRVNSSDTFDQEDERSNFKFEEAQGNSSDDNKKRVLRIEVTHDLSSVAAQLLEKWLWGLLPLGLLVEGIRTLPKPSDWFVLQQLAEDLGQGETLGLVCNRVILSQLNDDTVLLLMRLALEADHHQAQKWTIWYFSRHFASISARHPEYLRELPRLHSSCSSSKRRHSSIAQATTTSTEGEEGEETGDEFYVQLMQQVGHLTVSPPPVLQYPPELSTISLASVIPSISPVASSSALASDSSSSSSSSSSSNNQNPPVVGPSSLLPTSWAAYWLHRLYGLGQERDFVISLETFTIDDGRHLYNNNNMNIANNKESHQPSRYRLVSPSFYFKSHHNVVSNSSRFQSDEVWKGSNLMVNYPVHSFVAMSRSKFFATLLLNQFQSLNTSTTSETYLNVTTTTSSGGNDAVDAGNSELDIPSILAAGSDSAPSLELPEGNRCVTIGEDSSSSSSSSSSKSAAIVAGTLLGKDYPHRCVLLGLHQTRSSFEKLVRYMYYGLEALRDVYRPPQTSLDGTLGMNSSTAFSVTDAILILCDLEFFQFTEEAEAEVRDFCVEFLDRVRFSLENCVATFVLTDALLDEMTQRMAKAAATGTLFDSDEPLGSPDDGRDEPFMTINNGEPIALVQEGELVVQDLDNAVQEKKKQKRQRGLVGLAEILDSVKSRSLSYIVQNYRHLHKKVKQLRPELRIEILEAIVLVKCM